MSKQEQGTEGVAQWIKRLLGKYGTSVQTSSTYIELDVVGGCDLRAEVGVTHGLTKQF